jgi:hypothetical protein
MSDSPTSDTLTLCPECMVAAVGNSDGPFCCSNCGWSEEDEGSGFSPETLEMLEDAEHEDHFGD